MASKAVSISGRVIDGGSLEAIPYVNIGIKKGDRGTVSDENGYFRLDTENIPQEATLRFSYIGYEIHDISIAEFHAECSDYCEIRLTPKILEMQEVFVYPKKFKEKIVGNPHAPAMMRGGFTEDSLGYEIGIFVKLKPRPTVLKELNLHGIVTSYDSVFYRVNVYAMQDKLPGKNILSKPIYISLGDFEQNADISIDLTPYHIVVQDDFVITLEYVRELGEGDLTFSTGIFNGKIFYRRTSQAEWYSAPFGLGMSVLISYQK